MAEMRYVNEDITRILVHVTDLQQALKAIQRVVCSIDGPTWEEAQEEHHPLWEALNTIDSITLKALTYRIEPPAQFDGEVAP